MQKTCTFFGHRDFDPAAKQDLYAAIEELILNHNVERFYVGNQGSFDYYVRSTLKDLKKKYPHISYFVVLAYLAVNKTEYEDYTNTIFPEGLENVPPRFAISWRNRWLLKQSQFVISYVHYSWGGAAQFVEIAKKQGKTVINIFKEKQ